MDLISNTKLLLDLGALSKWYSNRNVILFQDSKCNVLEKQYLLM